MAGPGRAGLVRAAEVTDGYFRHILQKDELLGDVLQGGSGPVFFFFNYRAGLLSAPIRGVGR